jgi:hypothetical protein
VGLRERQGIDHADRFPGVVLPVQSELKEHGGMVAASATGEHDEAPVVGVCVVALLFEGVQQAVSRKVKLSERNED